MRQHVEEQAEMVVSRRSRGQRDLRLDRAEMQIGRQTDDAIGPTIDVAAVGFDVLKRQRAVTQQKMTGYLAEMDQREALGDLQRHLFGPHRRFAPVAGYGRSLDFGGAFAGESAGQRRSFGSE